MGKAKNLPNEKMAERGPIKVSQTIMASPNFIQDPERKYRQPSLVLLALWKARENQVFPRISSANRNFSGVYPIPLETRG